MTKAVEQALEAYPEELTTAYGPLPGASVPCIIDSNRPYRIGFKRGYEQAEKDLALTPDDIGKIFNKVKAEGLKWTATEACYPDVAKWFNEQRAKER